MEFTEAVNNFLELAQQLIFNIFSRIAHQYIDTPVFKKFLKNADLILEIGHSFVEKKMRELKEMDEKGIDQDDAQGALTFYNARLKAFLLSCFTTCK